MRFTFFLLLLLFPVFAHAEDAKTFNAQHFTLNNGLELVVVENHRAPVVTHMVWYKVGAADETAGLSGMAHFLEHLLFKGTKALPPGEYSRIVREFGGQSNAFTGQDYTAYFVTAGPQHLEQIMRLEAERMLRLDVPMDHFLSERDVISEERRQVVEANPNRAFSEQIDAALYVNHPYGTPIIGWREEIESLEWRDVYAFYKKWYRPDNAIIVLSGAISAEDALSMARQIYGPLENPDETIMARNRTKIPAVIKGPKSITRTDDTVRETTFSRTTIIPGHRQAPEITPTFDVLQELLSGTPATYLYDTLVVEQKVATSVNVHINTSAWDYGDLSISAVPAPDTSRAILQARLDATLRDLIQRGFTQDEINGAKKRLTRSAVFARDSVSGPAFIIGRALSTGVALDDIEYWPSAIEDITMDQINETLKTYLDPDNDTQNRIDAWLIPNAEHNNDY